MTMTNSLFPPADAEALAARLRADDPEWLYVVRHAPAGRGLSFIEVYDDEGVFVGKL